LTDKKAISKLSSFQFYLVYAIRSLQTATCHRCKIIATTSRGLRCRSAILPRSREDRTLSFSFYRRFHLQVYEY